MATHKYFKVSFRNPVKQINKVISLNLSSTVSEALHEELETFEEDDSYILKSVTANDEYEIKLDTPVHVWTEFG